MSNYSGVKSYFRVGFFLSTIYTTFPNGMPVKQHTFEI
jgi:hypothetical protein